MLDTAYAHCMYPPAGNPQPPGYPQPQYYPMPPPPWQQQQYGQQQPNPGSGRRGMYLAVGAGFLVMMLIMGSLFFLLDEDGQYFYSGNQVTPTADESVVFVKENDLNGQAPSSVTCTATTESGGTVTLNSPSEPQSVSRGSRPSTKYVSVAELPTDKGELTVTCAANGDRAWSNRMLLAKPGFDMTVVWFFVGYGILMAILILVVVLVRRRYFRRFPKPGSGYSA